MQTSVLPVPLATPLGPIHRKSSLFSTEPQSFCLAGSADYSTLVDLWSVGCIFAEVISKCTFFDGVSEQDQIRKIFRIMGTPTDEVWPGVSQLPGFSQIKWEKYERMDLKKEVK